MVEQRTLANVAVDSVAVVATYAWEKGWTLRFTTRRNGSDLFETAEYEGLTSSELVDVVSAELERSV